VTVARLARLGLVKLLQFWNSLSFQSVDNICTPYLTKMSSEEGKLNEFQIN